MKWFTAANYSSLQNPKFWELVQVAVRSAQANTSLTPCFLYEGEQCPQLEWLDRQGVLIFETRLTISQQIENFLRSNCMHDRISARLGSWLRLELAPTLRAAGLTDSFVLYTDVDVVFLREVNLEQIRPATLAAVSFRCGGYTRFHIFGTRHFNAGVLLLNVDAMVQSYSAFRSFILANAEGVRRPKHPYPFIQKHLFLSDQVALNLFYGKKASYLPPKYNWNPSQGVNPKAVIIHWNGLKWNEWDSFLAGTLPERKMKAFTPLVNRNKEAYKYYCEVAKTYRVHSM